VVPDVDVHQWSDLPGTDPVTWSEWIQAPDYLTAPDALNAPYYGVMDSDATDYAHSGGPVNTATVVAGVQLSLIHI